MGGKTANRQQTKKKNVTRSLFTERSQSSATIGSEMQYLVKNGMTDLKALAAGEFSTNYAGVDTLGDMGTQFTVRRQDVLEKNILNETLGLNK